MLLSFDLIIQTKQYRISTLTQLLPTITQNTCRNSGKVCFNKQEVTKQVFLPQKSEESTFKSDFH